MLNVKTSVLYKIVKTIYTHTYVHTYIFDCTECHDHCSFISAIACIFIYKFLVFFNREHQSLLFTSSGALNISINNQLKIIEFIVYLETTRFDKPTVII